MDEPLAYIEAPDRGTLRLLAGRPLLDWTLSVVARSEHALRPVVATRSRRVGHHVEERWPDVETWMPRAELKDPWATLLGRRQPTIAMRLSVRTPCRGPEDLDGSLELLDRSGADMVLAASPRPGAMLLLRGQDIWARPFSRLRMAEGVERQMIPSPAVRVATGEAARWLDAHVSTNTAIWEMPATRTIDVATPEGWMEAEEHLEGSKRELDPVAAAQRLLQQVFAGDGGALARTLGVSARRLGRWLNGIELPTPPEGRLILLLWRSHQEGKGVHQDLAGVAWGSPEPVWMTTEEIAQILGCSEATVRRRARRERWQRGWRESPETGRPLRTYEVSHLPM